ncbi:YggN family protein [Marixanthomonas spongiae]|uniref:Adhesin domain-containing protein n=1 Tax=Marixanthomonas spongiae TaxID=2174845 RepID=A0A2U0I0E2_9FLAO|nr:hypothetical protein [Marixanthomonas spongiae]PVW14574.1 hypothetical protein DDV96_08570 [Marixanthomonas spongiae]
MKLHVLFKTVIPTMLLLLCTTISMAQKQYKETFNVKDDVTVLVNTSHTNIIFETWNKDKVEVEAYIEGGNLSEAEKQELFDNWNLSVLGNSNKVVITSKGGGRWNGVASMNNMESLQDLEFLGPMLKDMITPMVTNMKIPNLPDDLMKDLSSIDFDYEEFMEDKEAYMKKFEAQMDKKFGKDFEVKMERWGNEFAEQFNEEKSDSIAAHWESRMNAWGENFGKKMEAWGKRFEKEMEEKYGKDGKYSKKVITGPNGNKTVIIQGSKTTTSKSVKPKGVKTIKIKMPKGAKTEINVRHGDIEMADAVNVRATLNHSPFTANSIDGGNTLINASYAPVVVNNWKDGSLYIQFVQNCTIADVSKINLRANSSDVLIGTIANEAVLAGSFGNLKVSDISEGFKNIDILLENTDAKLSMPETAFSFYFNGKQSTLKYPKSLQLNRIKNNNRILVSGYHKNNKGGKNLTVNANYSNVRIQ